jgi:hypothetical protein
MTGGTSEAGTAYPSGAPEITPVLSGVRVYKEEFEDTKGIIRIRKSKDRQHNGQRKKDKRTNNDQQNIHIKKYNIYIESC